MRLPILSTLVFATGLVQSANGAVIYVTTAAPAGGDGTSWKTAFNDLQDGLAAATPGSGDQLWVAAGIYRPTGPGGDRAISFNLVSGTGLYGGFNGTETKLEERDPAVNVTVLSGDLNGDDVGDALDPSHSENAYCVVRVTNAAAGTLVDGLTITSGNSNSSGGGMIISASQASILNCTITSNACSGSGCGVRVGFGGSVTVDDSRFSHNRAIGQADGVGLYAFQTTIAMSDCTLADNISETSQTLGQGGAMVLWESVGTIERCAFENNESYQAGAIQVVEGSGEISACSFVNNTQHFGGALLLFDPMTVKDCQFVGNEAEAQGGGLGIATFESGTQIINCFFAVNSSLTAHGGGISQQSGPATLINCVFTGNSAATTGGAIHMSGASGGFTLVNCTMANNVAGESAGGGFRTRGFPVASLITRNSIFWGNADSTGAGESAQLLNGPGSGWITFCDVQGWTGALGNSSNFGLDPLFIDADGPDNIVGTADDNLRLGAASPCINHADPLVLSPYPEDLDGEPRVQECIADLGAYESVDVDPSLPDCDGNGVQDGCDIAMQTGTDCNYNVVLDECDLASGTSPDTDINGVPDECQGVPANNTCTTAKLVPVGAATVTNLHATTDGPGGQVGCGFDDEQIHNDVWYRYVAQCGGIVTINLCNVNFDARLAVYMGCPSAGSQPIACSDNVCGLGPRVSFLAPTPLVYRIRIGGSPGPGPGGIGGGSMVITCTPNPVCAGDANGDGAVNINDLLLVVANWGQTGINPADVNGDSTVNIQDLLAVVAAWGPCT